jgi:hypothetical protein
LSAVYVPLVFISISGTPQTTLLRQHVKPTILLFHLPYHKKVYRNAQASKLIILDSEICSTYPSFFPPP